MYPIDAASNGAQNSYIAQSQHPQAMYRQNSNESMMMASFTQQMTGAGMDQSIGMHPTYQIPHTIPNGYNNHPGHPYHLPHHGFPDGMPPQSLPSGHIRHLSAPHPDSEGFENQSHGHGRPDTADRRRGKKGSATTIANDIELRKLLRNNNTRSLGDVAQEVQKEVQKSDGTNSKSEKPKQLFAMLWLQHCCTRSNASVRRDTVFNHYSVRCGDENIPALNPASFGKLVRIIFPDVLTRRLGIRGESKYHYVDLSLVSESDTAGNTSSMPEASSEHSGLPMTDGQGNLASRPQQLCRSLSFPQDPNAPTDTAEFPVSTHSLAPKRSLEASGSLPFMTTRSHTGSTDCRPKEPLLIPLNTRDLPPPVAEVLHRSLPSDSSRQPYIEAAATFCPPFPPPTAQDNVEMPNLERYLRQDPSPFDREVALNLSNIYRVFCRNMVSNFRLCLHKTLLAQHAAFPGTMTVPVQKLMSRPAVAPWVEECDMRMYRKMIQFASQLATQEVPRHVFDRFSYINCQLVKHIVEGFEKLPAHVIAAKVKSATRFIHLMKQLPQVNRAMVGAEQFIKDPSMRTSMWTDLLNLTDPEQIIEQGRFAPDCAAAAKNILRYDFKCLLSPEEAKIHDSFYNSNLAWTPFFNDVGGTDPENVIARSIEVNVEEVESAYILGQWIEYLQMLPRKFPGHSARCILNHHHLFWRSILADLGASGASSFQAWWILEIFLSAMLTWQVEVGGFLDDGSGFGSVRTNASTAGTISHDDQSHAGPATQKRKRGEEDVGGENRASRPSLGHSATPEIQEAKENDSDDQTDPQPDHYRHPHPASRRTHSQPSISATPLANKSVNINGLADGWKLPTLETGDALSPVKGWHGLSSTGKSRNNNLLNMDDSGLGPSLHSDDIELPGGSNAFLVPASAAKDPRELDTALLANSSDSIYEAKET
ncbi:MAG: hypothetical protein Q9227_002947 [Pyrenula ochraceoflavens]